MDISSCSSQLSEALKTLSDVPQEIFEIIRTGSNTQYLDMLTKLAFDSKYTPLVFASHQAISFELCVRWLSKSKKDTLPALASLALILPSAPALSVYADALLAQHREHSGVLTSEKCTALLGIPTERLGELLLTLFRLLKFDNHRYASAVPVSGLQLLLRNHPPYIRYLSIRVLCLYLYLSDSVMTTMTHTYIEDGAISGRWDGKVIDYRLLSLLEEKRLNNLALTYKQGWLNQKKAERPGQHTLNERVVANENLSAGVACVAGVLLPKLGKSNHLNSSLVMTLSTKENLRMLADGIQSSRPLLVTGFPGIGKTSAIEYLAKCTGRHHSMITLHLNEQTDCKALIGIYANAASSGSFTWCPGILVKAVLEGRWLVIEDLDRAPMEIFGLILPLLERGELIIPNQGRTIRANPGFKLIATLRSTSNNQGEEVLPSLGMVGMRHWLRIPFNPPKSEELVAIIQNKFPLVQYHLPKLMNIYHTLNDVYHSQASSSSKDSIRPLRPPDLFKWCKRVQSLLETAGVTIAAAPIHESMNDNIFLEAVDCFLGFLPASNLRLIGVNLIAQGLHMPEERAQYCLISRKPDYLNTASLLSVGRAILPKSQVPTKEGESSRNARYKHFAKTRYSVQILESLVMTVKQAEPCLLVGETGTGKTTVVQHLAEELGQKLTVFNLSQQSEAGDMLGGYKPINMRSLVMPLKDEFEELMDMTFTMKRNQHYVEALGKSIAKARWSRTLILWQEALKTIRTHFQSGAKSSESIPDRLSAKRRKVQITDDSSLRSRWNDFADRLTSFEKHLFSGSKGFAFSFVEGNIVKAARNGEWVLLDEINLASPDTLENLSDLIAQPGSTRPSVLLTDSGDTERIYAHQDFRIFGAMNPATDIGKRNLPTSLRSRFTEFFLEAPDKDEDNLRALVKTYLSRNSHVEERIVQAIAKLHIEVRQLADQNRLVDGANQKPHFSLRTLSRTLIYALEFAERYGVRRALYEGFFMNYLTTLDAASIRLVQPLIDTCVFDGTINRKALLRQLPRGPKNSEEYVQCGPYWVARGAAPIARLDRYVITPFIERNLLELVRAASTRKYPVLLQGPTSSGKTSMVEYLARISGNHFVRINNHEHTDLQEYLGTYVSGPDGQLQYQEGVLVDAVRKGYWVVLDELNLAPTDVLEALNRLLDDNRELLVPETQEMVRPHANFMLFATQNPPGLYGGRKVLSRAFRNRFLELHFNDIPEDELETILRERSQIAPSFCSKIVAVHKKLAILRQNERLFEQKDSFVTLRDLFRWALRDANNQEQLAVNGFLLLAERVRNQQERLAVKRVIEDVMRVKIDEDSLYKSRDVHQGPVLTSSGLVWTKSARRLHLLISEAMKKNEPILLVGETGSGKTTMCQVVAHEAGKSLNTVNAHQNFETSDLIGSQRPIRDKIQAETELVRELTTFLAETHDHSADIGDNFESLIKVYDAIRRSRPELISVDRNSHIQHLRTKVTSLFEWIDGTLVNAMRCGQHFLLDEMSLAEDSVLERLNSVLEPDRQLFLAEKGPSDSHVKAATGFQFLATMNPGGDYGKRELSPALRNRFTEIWVPSTSSEEEMLEIVHAKLAKPFSQFCRPMVSFAGWYAGTYNPTKPFISIRDLLSWVNFINNNHLPDAYASVLHGAAVIYLDGLGANPASKLSIAEDHISKERNTCLLKLNVLFNHDIANIYHSVYRLSSSDTKLEIGPFSLAKSSSGLQNQHYSLQAPTTIGNVMKIVRALHLHKPILLEGTPGVGKTTLITTLAQEMGVRLTRINLSDQTDLVDLFGSDVPLEGLGAGAFAWRDAPFLRAMQNGEWVLLDEMNLASQSVLEGLNSCLDHRGSMYVSELNRTFYKHPDFVVFAAQNPHKQGAGRKGLPASFIDRFSVVYAEGLSMKDLRIISHELYPRICKKSLEQVCDAIAALVNLLAKDKRIGANGAPWEINLRDVLRWLHLLSIPNGLIPFATSAEYLNMLLLQRFRTCQDVAAVACVLRQSFPSDQPRTLFYGKCDKSLNIGFGLLPRKRDLQPIPHRTAPHFKVDLSLSESVMLCLQVRWPCLLVGASGSGKSNLVSQLANLTGNEVVTLSLSPETDIMDLIGGYEQASTERQAIEFRRVLWEYIRKQLSAVFVRDEGPGEPLALLERQLRLESANIEDLLPLIQHVAQQFPESKFPAFLVDGSTIIEHKALDTRTCFEWVDGLLVKALQQGSWLVLDNANLCNASVLDRLNQLLEPGGILSIHEHRNQDGSPRTIIPHEDFRIFMTMDPRHGELSQAMRNRSIEIFVPSRSPCTSAWTLHPNIEPRLSNLNLFEAFDWSAFSDDDISQIVRICFDHLTYSNLIEYPQWQIELTHGLTESQKEIFQAIAQGYASMVHRDGIVFQAIRNTYQIIERDRGSMTGYNSIQTLNPFNNTVLLSHTDSNPPMSNLRWLAQCFEFMSEVHCFTAQLNAIGGDLVEQSNGSAKWNSEIHKTVNPVGASSVQRDWVRSLMVVLKDVGTCLLETLDSKDIHMQQYPQETLLLANDVLDFIKDLPHFVRSSDFNDATWHVLISIGEGLFDQLSIASTSNMVASTLKTELLSRISATGFSQQLYSGLDMESLWAALRPPVAAEMTQLHLELLIKDFAVCFDDLIWKSSASVPELLDLQEAIIQISQGTASGVTEPNKALDLVREALDDIKSRSDKFTKDIAPYFQHHFSVILQLGHCSNILGPLQSSNVASRLHLFASRPTASVLASAASNSGWKALYGLSMVSAIGHPVTELAGVRNTLPMSIIRRLRDSHNVPLQALELFRVELTTLASAIFDGSDLLSRKPMSDLIWLLQTLKSETQRAIGGTSSQNNDINANLHQLFHQFGSPDQMHNSMDEKIKFLHDCHQSIESFEHPDTHESSDHDLEGYANIASNYTKFFTGCLIRFVPNRPFDPALRQSLNVVRHQKRTNDMTSKLRALQQFESAYTGQQTSLRIQLAEDHLRSLGAEPAKPSIVRPQLSELGDLQTEFNSILRTIVMKLPQIDLADLSHADYARTEDVKLLRANVNRAIARLSARFESYQDITRIVIAMLQGLDIGLALAVIACCKRQPADLEIESLCEQTPLMALSAFEHRYEPLQQDQIHTTDSLKVSTNVLRRVAMQRDVLGDLDGSTVLPMLQAFHHSYQTWKAQLTQDQLNNSSRSSFYRYRGVDNIQAESEDQEFERLFPDFDDNVENSTRLPQLGKDPTAVAQCVTLLHRRIFSQPGDSGQAVVDYLRDLSGQTADLWRDDSNMRLLHASAETLLNSLLISLDEVMGSLEDKSSSKTLYNFYSDANLSESQRLVLLVQKVFQRFLQLQDAWPEHATLSDVIQSCSDLLSMSHVEPVAKFLKKTEKLHGYVYEWQRNASREYSAESLYIQLTDLLRSWRALELSTWARLIDMEDFQCEIDSSKWWFIAYEVIVAVPLSSADEKEDLRLHAGKLYDSLVDFLSTASLGQFKHRLDIIRCFQSHLQACLTEYPSLSITLNTLTNFLHYYTHFQVPILDQLRKGRFTSEKEVKEIILSARWKDTTIEALRSSAKRSHHKLFKVVRKYRSLLAEPAGVMLSEGISVQSENLPLQDTMYGPPVPGDVDPRALQMCRQRVHDWKTKPERFIKAAATAHQILQMGLPSSEKLDGSSHIQSLIIELKSNIEILRKETPLKATKENYGSLKHLKSRKRKQYSDVLKLLRHMGLRTNIDVEALEKQASPSKVLSNGPPLSCLSHHSLVNAAELCFHKLLNLLPQAREISRSHCHDLNPGEAARSLGFLESLVAIISRQRSVLVHAITGVESFERTKIQMQTICTSSSNVKIKQDHGEVTYCKEVHRLSKWSCAIVKAGSAMVKKYGHVVGTDMSGVIAQFSGWKDTVQRSIQRLENLPNLPSGLASSQHNQAVADANVGLMKIQKDAELLAEQQPNIAFVLRHIQAWTSFDMSIASQIDGCLSTKISYSIAEFDGEITSIFDSILVATQRIQQINSNSPATDEDPGWMSHIVACLSKGWDTLHRNKINDNLENALSQLQLLGCKDQSEFDVGIAICTMALPVVEQFCNLQHETLAHHMRMHGSLCNFANFLAESYCQIGRNGFCNPAEDVELAEGKAEQVEGGTGLGEGDGVEDISKDVKDDEDLTEIAQQRNKDEDKENIDDQEAAVNMDHDDMEGQFGSGSEKEGEGKSDSEDSEDNGSDLDEERGDVDALDPSAIDEKLWDEKAKASDREKQSDLAKGQARTNELEAAHSDARQEASEANETGDMNEEDAEGQDEGKEMQKEDMEGLDPHCQDGQVLDLPEDMDLDNTNDNEISSDSDDSAMDDVCDADANDLAKLDHRETPGSEFEDSEFEDSTDVTQPQSEQVKEEIKRAKSEEAEGSVVSTEPSDEEVENDKGLLARSSDSTEAAHPEEAASNESKGLGNDADQDMQDDQNTTNEQSQASHENQGKRINQMGTLAEIGDDHDPQRTEESDKSGAPEGVQVDDQTDSAFKKLGNALEKWHRQRKQIAESSDKDSNSQQKETDPGMEGLDFEHLQNDADDYDTQALGAASNEQAKALDLEASASEIVDNTQQSPPNNAAAANIADDDDYIDDLGRTLESAKLRQEQREAGVFIDNTLRTHTDKNDSMIDQLRLGDDIDSLDDELSITHTQPGKEPPRLSTEQARRLWSHFESITHDMSLSLTEQFRLILAPTLATKMRGDFRTGKRLNIKRIIPYIASDFKRDKIWMRRSIPSKRNYQIMLAVDDSKSMSESGSGQLAFETLALVAKSLSMLEAGQICIIGFGEDVHVAHEFDKPFSSDAGAQVFQQFGFQQSKTHVRRLVAESIKLFREARGKTFNAGADLWQLEIIISDGVCEDHDSIQQLVRQAQEERIMIIFVIVDALLKEDSIMDMSQAVFQQDASGVSKLHIKRYLDGFPFPYYLVVGNVNELPNVLAQALRQWFNEVAGE